MTPDCFILTCYDGAPNNYLHGFCFQGEDLILGNEGYAKYRAERQSEVKPGQDGAYIVVRHNDQETVVGTDFSGYCKLFLYQHETSWALSNSLIQLARFAAERKLPVTIDESQLAAFFIKGAFGNQLVSLQTSVKEVRLVPSTMEVVISSTVSGGQVALRQTSMVSQISLRYDNYAAALREYMRLWAGRMATVLRSDLFVRSDLTGGRDSRAVLSLMLAAAEQVGWNHLPKISFRSGERAREDFTVATAIAERFQLRISGERDHRSPVRIGLAESYEKWKALCLGVYMPVYFPSSRPVPTAISFSGAGGEGHRRFYPDMNPEDFLDVQRRHLPSLQHFRKIKQDVLDDLAFLRQEAEGSVDPMVLHYRHFRDRCHGGRTPQYANTLSPLASSVLRQASSLCSTHHIDRSQVLADILINANRELAGMAYDHPKKSFDAQHLAELTEASEAIRSASKDGFVFAGEPMFQEPGNFTQADALVMLRDDFLSHYDEMRRTGFFPKKYIEEARRSVDEAAKNGRFRHAVEGSAVSHVILAGELSRLSHSKFQEPWSLLGRLKTLILER